MNNFNEAKRLEEIAVQMKSETTDQFRHAEINNIRAMLTTILTGLLSDEDDAIISEVSKRLTYLHRHPKSSGMHSMHPNAINKGEIVKR